MKSHANEPVLSMPVSFVPLIPILLHMPHLTFLLKSKVIPVLLGYPYVRYRTSLWFKIYILQVPGSTPTEGLFDSFTLWSMTPVHPNTHIQN